MTDQTTEEPQTEPPPVDEPIKPDSVQQPDGTVITPDASDLNPEPEPPQFIERADGEAYTWEQLSAMSVQLSKSTLLPEVYRRKPENVMVAAIMAQELGWGVTTAMRFVHVIEGKPTVSPEGMLALVRRAGHSVTGESTSQVAELRGRRCDNGDEMWVRFTLEDAKAAKLTGKDNWVKYPDAMLWARALGMLCRRLFSDVLLGAAYTPDELGAVTDEKGEPIVVDGEVLKAPNWGNLGWRDEAHLNEHRLETKIIMDALPREARDEVRRLAGPTPDISAYSIGVWTRRHSIVLDVARKAGLVDENDRLIQQEPSNPDATPEATESDEEETDVCLLCDAVVLVSEFEAHVADCEAAEREEQRELPEPGLFDDPGYG